MNFQQVTKLKNKTFLLRVIVYIKKTEQFDNLLV